MTSTNKHAVAQDKLKEGRCICGLRLTAFLGHLPACPKSSLPSANPEPGEQREAKPMALPESPTNLLHASPENDSVTMSGGVESSYALKHVTDPEIFEKCSFGKNVNRQCQNNAKWISTFEGKDCRGENGALIWCDDHKPKVTVPHGARELT